MRIILCLFLFNITAAAQDLSRGLLACYPINGNEKDASNNQRHAGKTNLALTIDRFGRDSSAYSYNGVDSFFEIDPNFLKLANFTVSVWVRLNTLTKRQVIWSVGSSNAHQFILFDPQKGFEAGGSVSLTETYSINNNLNIKSNTWYHLILMRDPNNLFFYINGKQADTYLSINKIPFYGTNAPRAGFGRSVTREAGYVDGDIDDIHIYSRSLNSIEISTLYEGQKLQPIELTVSDLTPCGGDAITLKLKGASDTDNFKWQYDTQKKFSYFDSLNVVTLAKEKDYDIRASVEIIDGQSCFPQKPRTAVMFLKVRECRELTKLLIPNVFSPNNDGVNDTWQIKSLERIPEAIVKVYDRYGLLVFESRGYAQPWNGNVGTKRALPGQYTYVISTNIKGEKVLKGTLLLVR